MPKHNASREKLRKRISKEKKKQKPIALLDELEKHDKELEGPLRPVKESDDIEDLDDDDMKQSLPAGLSKKTLSLARAQQMEVATGLSFASSDKYDDADNAKRKGAKTEKFLSLPDDEDEDLLGLDVEEEEEEIEEVELTAEDEQALAMFMPAAAPARRTLADVIMDTIARKNAQGPEVAGDEAIRPRLNPKVVEVYQQVGKYLAKYTSGKVPKAFKVVPRLKNWEEVLQLTEPENWTSQAYYVATRLFASNLNPKMAQRFYSLVLLPRVQQDIEQHKRLNYHLYQSLKKAIFKPAAFFKGIVLSLAEYGTSIRTAVIICSILQKCSIPMLHSSVALLKLTELPYTGTTTLIMKTLLDKKYSLPYKVLDALVDYFCSFSEEERKLPVIWHLNVLTFVRRYKFDLTQDQRQRMRKLLSIQPHRLITPEIRRELFAPLPAAAASGSAAAMQMGGQIQQANFRAVKEHTQAVSMTD